MDHIRFKSLLGKRMQSTSVVEMFIIYFDLTFDSRAADETKSWMNEKDNALMSDDYGRDLASVQALQRKHEGLERDLAALEDKVKQLRLDAAQVIGAQPSASKSVRAKEKEIVDAWTTLKSRVSLYYQYTTFFINYPVFVFSTFVSE